MEFNYGRHPWLGCQCMEYFTMPTIIIPEKEILESVKRLLGITTIVKYKFFRDKLGRQRLRIWC